MREGPIAELWDSENESSEDDGQHFGDEDTGSERDASGLLQGSGDEVSESTQVSKSVLVVDSRPIQTHRASGQGFDACSGVCLHPAGNVFVADTGNHRIVVVEGTEAPLNCVCAPVPRTDRLRPRMLSLGDFIHPFAGSDGFDGYENGQPDGVWLAVRRKALFSKSAFQQRFSAALRACAVTARATSSSPTQKIMRSARSCSTRARGTAWSRLWPEV